MTQIWRTVNKPCQTNTALPRQQEYWPFYEIHFLHKYHKNKNILKFNKNLIQSSLLKCYRIAFRILLNATLITHREMVMLKIAPIIFIKNNINIV